MTDEQVKPTRAQVVLAEVVSAFTRTDAKRIDELGPEEATRASLCEVFFTASVRTMMAMDSEVLRELGEYAWKVFGRGHVKLAMGPDVPSLSIAVVKIGGFPRALVFAPLDWPEMADEDPVMQFGAVITAASQAVDFYNGMVPPRESGDRMKRRSLSYEAEYLKMLDPGMLNDYQKDVLKQFPRGFDRHLSYPRKPVEEKD